MFRQVLLSPGEIKGGQRSPRDQTFGFRRNRGAVLGFARLPLLPPLVESSEAQASRQELWIQGDSLLQILLGCWKLSRLFLQNAESQIRRRFTLRHLDGLLCLFNCGIQVTNLAVAGSQHQLRTDVIGMVPQDKRRTISGGLELFCCKEKVSQVELRLQILGVQQDPSRELAIGERPEFLLKISLSKLGVSRRKLGVYFNRVLKLNRGFRILALL